MKSQPRENDLGVTNQEKFHRGKNKWFASPNLSTSGVELHTALLFETENSILTFTP